MQPCSCLCASLPSSYPLHSQNLARNIPRRLASVFTKVSGFQSSSFRGSKLVISDKSATRTGQILHSRRLTTRSMADVASEDIPDMRVLFVEMGVGYDQHGQDITAAATRACRDAIASNSIPAFRAGAIPGVSWQQMKLKVVLGVPQRVQRELDLAKVRAVFPYGDIVGVSVVDGGLICSSGVALEAMGDKNDDCYVVNAAVYVGY
eukprot:jgi/Mesen1/4814/ME000243S03993